MEKNRLYGLGEPISMQVLAGKIDADETLARVEALGVTAFREWMHIPQVLSDPETVNPATYPVYTKVLDRLRELDIEITGMSHEWFLAGEVVTAGHNAMFARDLTPGSDYMRTLGMLETSWKTMAAAFPQVTQWEVGNEWNTDTFLHPVDWIPGSPGFTDDEKMDIAVDLMYFAAKGIRAGNPSAKVVSFSPAVAQPNLGSRTAVFCPPGYGIPLAFSKIYERIKSGRFPSTDTDDYFDLLAWHPYLLTQIMPMAACEEYPATRRFFRAEDIDAAWRAVNDMVYTVMTMNGDGHKKVLLTEMGFSDWGDPALEEKQAEMTERMFAYVKTMPYVKTVHAFRLYTPKVEDVGEAGFLPVGERYFGMFLDTENGIVPRKKAYALQRACGGTAELR
ncbi:MAG: hypothetical protein J6V24_05650 [Clostridia bacterium]|nr:hypothetical protein [Clostridia bacterium]